MSWSGVRFQVSIVTCPESYVVCHLSHITKANSLRHGRLESFHANSYTMHNRMACKDLKIKYTFTFNESADWADLVSL